MVCNYSQILKVVYVNQVNVSDYLWPKLDFVEQHTKQYMFWVESLETW